MTNVVTSNKRDQKQQTKMTTVKFLNKEETTATSKQSPYPFSFFDSEDEEEDYKNMCPVDPILEPKNSADEDQDDDFQEVSKKREKQTNCFATVKKSHLDLPCKNVDCKFGDKCFFAHTIDDFEPTPCKYDKRCTKEDKCTFKHSFETKASYAKRRGMTFHNVK